MVLCFIFPQQKTFILYVLLFITFESVFIDLNSLTYFLFKNIFLNFDLHLKLIQVAQKASLTHKVSGDPMTPILRVK